MKKKILAKNLFVGDYGWHTGRFHFPFADYDDPDNGHFGVMEALNDFELDPETGFKTHPHDEMEIISVCIEGSLVHIDNMGHENTLHPGDVQYLCAGSGITHSEANADDCGLLRFLQIWITPNRKGLSPGYWSKEFSKNPSKNKFQLVVSGKAIGAAIKIQQDVNIYLAEIDKKEQFTISNQERRQSYLYCIDGNLAGNDVDLFKYDALKLWERENLSLTALENSHIIMIEMTNEDII